MKKGHSFFWAKLKSNIFKFDKSKESTVAWVLSPAQVRMDVIQHPEIMILYISVKIYMACKLQQHICQIPEAEISFGCLRQASSRERILPVSVEGTDQSRSCFLR